MLDQLIESKTKLNENRRRSGFLLTTFTAVISLSALALIYSLFSYNLAMASEKLDLSSLVAPIPVVENEPQPPKTENQSPKQNQRSADTSPIEIRRLNMQRTDEVPADVPKEVSINRNAEMSRPIGKFSIGPINISRPAGGIERGDGNSEDGTGIGLGKAKQIEPEEKEKDLPPVMKTPEPKKQTPPIIKTSKILNGEAKFLAKPPYPPPARAVHAYGTVNVQVMIDENGNVTSANAVSGHPLLRYASEQAARSSKFNPTILNDQKVKVTGVIVYNFIAQ